MRREFRRRTAGRLCPGPGQPDRGCAIDGLAEQIKLTNNHVERLNRGVDELRTEIGGMRSEVGSLRLETPAGFDHVDNELRDVRSEVILQANQIISAQQQATRATLRLDDMEQRPDPPAP